MSTICKVGNLVHKPSESLTKPQWFSVLILNNVAVFSVYNFIPSYGYARIFYMFVVCS